jgi:hypothetical protein
LPLGGIEDALRHQGESGDAGETLFLTSHLDLVLRQVGQSLTRRGYRVLVMSNIASSALTVRVPRGDRTKASCYLKNFRLPEHARRSIVVADLAIHSLHGLSEADTQYASQEFLAAWMALLASSPCKVVNRPSTEYPHHIWTSLQYREFARHAGVRTVDEEICDKRAAERKRLRGEDLACIDLFEHQPFWLSDAVPFKQGRSYSIVNIAKNAALPLW